MVDLDPGSMARASSRMLDRVTAVDVVVTGLVQGVGFRWATRRAADRLGVCGWVRNLVDGAVEAHLEGPGDAVAEMVSWLRRGPDAARVASVDTSASVVEGRFGFRIEA